MNTRYTNYQTTCAAAGFIMTPMSERVYDELSKNGATDSDIYSIGCDIAAGFDNAAEEYLNSKSD